MGGGASGLRIDRQANEAYSAIITPKDIQTDTAEVQLKIVRKGRIFSAFWRENDASEWRQAADVETNYPDTILAGLIARSTVDSTIADFFYVRLLPVEK